MGEKMKFGAGMLCLDGEPVMSIQEVPEFVENGDPEEESKEAFSLEIPEITGDLVIPKLYLPRIRKILSGFDRCKGPGRYKSIAKCLKYMQKACSRTRRYLQTLINIGDIDEKEQITVPIDVTGLPCTDIYEYFWFRIAIVEDATSYANYRGEKLRKTARSKRRSHRR